jgi:hypothetical protein
MVGKRIVLMCIGIAVLITTSGFLFGSLLAKQNMATQPVPTGERAVLPMQ